MKKQLLGITAPAKECTDKNCPFHGELSVKKELFEGKVIKKDTHRSATMEWIRPHYVQKYERYETRRSRMRVHNPPCLDAQIGQVVLAAKTRPLSKTKNHVIIKINPIETAKKNLAEGDKYRKGNQKENESSKE